MFLKRSEPIENSVLLYSMFTFFFRDSEEKQSYKGKRKLNNLFPFPSKIIYTHTQRKSLNLKSLVRNKPNECELRKSLEKYLSSSPSLFTFFLQDFFTS